MSNPTTDREARFRALYTDSYADVLRFVQRRAHPSHAEDAAAEAFLVAWRRFDDAPHDPSDQRAWVFGIARHCLLNTHRGHERRAALAVRLADHGAPARLESSSDDHVAHRLDVEAAWQRLPAAQQEVLALTVFEDLAAPQAARALGISATAYRLRLMRARRALRQLLDTPGPAVLHHKETSA